MEDLQEVMQSILSDPEQMARVAALVESLGLKPPEDEATGTSANSAESPVGSRCESRTAMPGATSQAFGRLRQQATGETKDSSVGAAIGRPHEAEASEPRNDLNLENMMSLLSASSGGEARVLAALRPALAPEARSRVDRALRAAKLSRLAGALLAQRRRAHV